MVLDKIFPLHLGRCGWAPSLGLIANKLFLSPQRSISGETIQKGKGSCVNFSNHNGLCNVVCLGFHDTMTFLHFFAFAYYNSIPKEDLLPTFFPLELFQSQRCEEKGNCKQTRTCVRYKEQKIINLNSVLMNQNVF